MNRARPTSTRTREAGLDVELAVKEILGTAVSVGCTVNGKNPKDIQAEVDAGTEVPQ